MKNFKIVLICMDLTNANVFGCRNCKALSFDKKQCVCANTCDRLVYFQTLAANVKDFFKKNKQIKRKYFCYPKINQIEILSPLLSFFHLI